jgi:hypothetical protein
VGAGDDLYVRVERKVPELARQIVAGLIEQVPGYRALPREQLGGEITGIVGENLRLFFRVLRAGRLPDEAEIAGIRESAARRAEERFPLPAVLAGYALGGRVGWRGLVAAARPGEQAELIAAAEHLYSYLQVATAAVAAAYLEEQQAIYGEQRDGNRALAQALLSGQNADALAVRLGVPLPAGHVVLACHLAPHPDEQDSAVEAAVAARRKLRRVNDRLTGYAGGPVLGMLEPAGGVVLLPADADCLPAAAGALRLVDELQAAAGAPVTAGIATAASRAELPAAAEQAREVLRIAVGLGRPPGGYQLADVLVEYQLTRRSDAQPLLVALLAPLQRNPDLLDTLAAYLANDLDRRRTAAAVHVHPNTLDYRLRRIVELTGVDLFTSRGLQLCGAALAAFRVREAGGAQPGR